MSGMNPITMPETKQPEIKHSTASSVPPPVSERPARRGFGRSFAAGLMIALLGFGGGIAGYVVADQVDGQDDASTSTTASDQSFQPANDTGGAIELDTSTDGEGTTPRTCARRAEAPAKPANDPTMNERRIIHL